MLEKWIRDVLRAYLNRKKPEFQTKADRPVVKITDPGGLKTQLPLSSSPRGGVRHRVKGNSNRSRLPCFVQSSEGLLHFALLKYPCQAVFRGGTAGITPQGAFIRLFRRERLYAFITKFEKYRVLIFLRTRLFCSVKNVYLVRVFN